MLYISAYSRLLKVDRHHYGRCWLDGSPRANPDSSEASSHTPTYYITRLGYSHPSCIANLAEGVLSVTMKPPSGTQMEPFDNIHVRLPRLQSRRSNRGREGA
jgi:hypothetical protein